MQNTGGSQGVVSEPGAIPTNYLVYAGQVLQEHGVEFTLFLESVGLAADLTESGVSEVSQQQYYDLIYNILEAVDIPALGLKIGSKFTIADYGILGYAQLSCSTPGHAIRTFLHYQEIVGSSASFSEALHVEEDLACIEVHCQRTGEAMIRLEVEEAFAQYVAPGSVLQWREDFNVSRIDFSFADPGYASLYRDHFQCPVRFNQPANKMYFPLDILDKPNVLADETTTEVCQQQCDAILENLQQQGGLVEQVRRIIINRPGHPPSPEEIAGQLNISYRTLRRRLQDHDTSVSTILYDVRMSLAQEYLRQTVISLQEIAYLLGYDEVNNFYRAFKKWSGQTAADYRKQYSQLPA